MRTFSFTIAGLIGGVIFNLPFLSWMNGHGWEWAYGFPIGWGGAGLNAMIVFFHELGHTIAAWFYGYPAFPSFDLTYGGGMTWMMAEQTIPILLGVYTLLIYGIFYFKGHWKMQAVMITLLIFNLLTALNDYHQIVVDFMGPGAEMIIAGFFLTRAWLDIAPRGAAERFLNALIGWGMIVQAVIQSHGLLFNEAMRAHYYNQKGTHGFGDFDKVADNLGADFQSVIGVWFFMAAIAAFVPILLCIVTKKDGVQH